MNFILINVQKSGYYYKNTIVWLNYFNFNFCNYKNDSIFVEQH